MPSKILICSHLGLSEGPMDGYFTDFCSSGATVAPGSNEKINEGMKAI